MFNQEKMKIKYNTYVKMCLIKYKCKVPGKGLPKKHNEK